MSKHFSLANDNKASLSRGYDPLRVPSSGHEAGNDESNDEEDDTSEAGVLKMMGKSAEQVDEGIENIGQRFVDVVNPRLRVFPHRGRIALCILLLNLVLVTLFAWWLKDSGKVLEYVTVESGDVLTNVASSWFHKNKHVCAAMDRCGEGDSEDREACTKGSFSFGCTPHGLPCNKFNCLGMSPGWTNWTGQEMLFIPFDQAHICTHDKCDEGLVRVVYAVDPGVMDCLMDSFNTISSFEALATMVVLSIYFCYQIGPCWCLSSDLRTDFAKTSMESRTDKELEFYGPSV